MHTQMENRFLTFGRRGTPADVDCLMDALHPDSIFADIKAADLALGFVEDESGRDRIRHYLFNGTSMQRNYAVNYFRRREERQIILQAWEQGRVDDIQAFSR